MKKTTLLLIVSFLMIGLAGNAQIKFGAKAGLNLASFSGDDTDDIEMKTAFHIGAAVEYGLTDAIAIQTGVLFSAKGAKEDEMSINLSYLVIPINFAYKLDKIQIFAGPYFGYAIAGNVDFDGDKEDIAFVNDLVDLEEDEFLGMKALDYGINVGVGYEVMENLVVQAAYGLGLGNLQPDFDGEASENTLSNTTIQIGATYFFGN